MGSNSRAISRTVQSSSELKMAIFEGNPTGKKIWDWVWTLQFMQKGESGSSPTTFGDAANVIKSNILQVYGGEPSIDGAPLATGEVDGLLEGSLFLGLKQYYDEFGSVYKLLFGPKSFIVISDPSIAKHILQTNAKAYDKGILAGEYLIFRMLYICIIAIVYSVW